MLNTESHRILYWHGDAIRPGSLPTDRPLAAGTVSAPYDAHTWI